MQSFNHDILVKIPCILASCIGTHITWSPPGTSGKTEQLPAADWAEAFMNFAVPRVWMIRTAWWIIGLVEIATILLRVAIPSSPYMPSGAFRLGLSGSTLIGVILIVLGTALRYVCYKHMSTQFTFELSIRSKHKLVTSGPYSVVRHPSYSGFIMVYAGLALWHGSRGSWMRESAVLDTLAGRLTLGTFIALLMVICYSILIRAPKEDEKLKEVFGKEWEEYAREVPYALVPGIL